MIWDRESPESCPHIYVLIIDDECFKIKFDYINHRKTYVDNICIEDKYYEENNLQMMLIGQIKDYDKCIFELEKFLPYVDNWATCDFPVPKCFIKNKKDVLLRVKKWIASDAAYVKRYGIGVMMRLFLDEDFKEEYLQIVADVKSEEYYVNMMIAWYMATALAKQWNAAIPYIQERRLPEWVHKKTIQKAVESYRITPEQKEYLKGFR